MRRTNIDLLLAIVIAIINILWTFFPYHPPLIGIIVAFPLVFILPGYTLIQALMPGVEPLQVLLFSLGLSLSIDILSGFILNFLPMGLQASSWAIFLGSLIFLFSLLAFYLRRKHPQTGSRIKFINLLHIKLRSAFLLGLAMLIVIVSIWYAINGVMEQPHPDFTQLWITPAKQGCAIQLGIQSFEAVPRRYSITLTLDATVRKIESSISLAPNQQWEKTISIPSRSAKQVHIEANLYRLDKPKTAYRTVSLNHNCP